MQYFLPALLVLWVSQIVACQAIGTEAPGLPPFERVGDAPLIGPDIFDDPAGYEAMNINGPSLIEAPDWLLERGAPGRYLLYFAHHKGKYLRLAYADELTGPWKLWPGGVLSVNDSPVEHHIASPDVHVDDDARTLRMYYHGKVVPEPDPERLGNRQGTVLATSRDGLRWDSDSAILGRSYFRVFDFNGRRYAVAGGGQVYRAPLDDESGWWERGQMWGADPDGRPRWRHNAVTVSGDRLLVAYSRWYDDPEHILLASVDLNGDWMTWRSGPSVSVVRPERDWEGAHMEPGPSKKGWQMNVRQLRDPAFFVDDGQTYLLYSVGGEIGIALGCWDASPAELLEYLSTGE